MRISDWSSDVCSSDLIRLVGFVTVEDLSRFEIAAEEECVAVYLPMSYQIGGYTAFIPRKLLTPVDMSLEDAMRFVVTAGVSRSPSDADKIGRASCREQGGQ